MDIGSIFPNVDGTGWCCDPNMDYTKLKYIYYKFPSEHILQLNALAILDQLKEYFKFEAKSVFTRLKDGSKPIEETVLQVDSLTRVINICSEKSARGVFACAGTAAHVRCSMNLMKKYSGSSSQTGLYEPQSGLDYCGGIFCVGIPVLLSVDSDLHIAQKLVEIVHESVGSPDDSQIVIDPTVSFASVHHTAISEILETISIDCKAESIAFYHSLGCQSPSRTIYFTCFNHNVLICVHKCRFTFDEFISALLRSQWANTFEDRYIKRIPRIVNNSFALSLPQLVQGACLLDYPIPFDWTVTNGDFAVLCDDFRIFPTFKLTLIGKGPFYNKFIQPSHVLGLSLRLSTCMHFELKCRDLCFLAWNSFDASVETRCLQIWHRLIQVVYFLHHEVISVSDQQIVEQKINQICGSIMPLQQQFFRLKNMYQLNALHICLPAPLLIVVFLKHFPLSRQLVFEPDTKGFSPFLTAIVEQYDISLKVFMDNIKGGIIQIPESEAQAVLHCVCMSRSPKMFHVLDLINYDLLQSSCGFKFKESLFWEYLIYYGFTVYDSFPGELLRHLSKLVSDRTMEIILTSEATIDSETFFHNAAGVGIVDLFECLLKCLTDHNLTIDFYARSNKLKSICDTAFDNGHKSIVTLIENFTGVSYKSPCPACFASIMIGISTMSNSLAQKTGLGFRSGVLYIDESYLGFVKNIDIANHDRHIKRYNLTSFDFLTTKEVIFKTLLNTDAKWLSNFTQEAAWMVALDNLSPGSFPTLFGVSCDPNMSGASLVIEKVDGETIEAFSNNRHASATLVDRLIILHDIIVLLLLLHSLNIRHNDLHSNNVMVSFNCSRSSLVPRAENIPLIDKHHVTIVDFGISKVVSEIEAADEVCDAINDSSVSSGVVSLQKDMRLLQRTVTELFMLTTRYNEDKDIIRNEISKYENGDILHPCERLLPFIQHFLMEKQIQEAQEAVDWID